MTLHANGFNCEQCGSHLWDYDHPYYCEEGGYYYNSEQVSGWGKPETYRTFDEFMNDWREADLTMNFLFRWDWKHFDKTTYRDEYCDDPPAECLNEDGHYSQLKLFLMMQRKGCKKVITVTHMRETDEDRVRLYLAERWEHMKEVWSGVSTQMTPTPTAIEQEKEG